MSEEKKKKNRKGMSDFQWFAMQVLIVVIILYVLFAHIVGGIKIIKFSS